VALTHIVAATLGFCRPQLVKATHLARVQALDKAISEKRTLFGR
jgi:hypothetical protein